MRQLLVHVPRGHGPRVVERAHTYDALNVAQFEAAGDDGPLDLVLVHLSNGAVGPFLDDLENLPRLHVSFAPQGVFTLQPPPEEAPRQVTDVQMRSPIEVFLAGHQSIGSWKGFLGYAFAAGIVVWIGLFTNTVYLLTAAMLIAPFAGPAMNVALATASGSLPLFRGSLLRYAAALAVTILTAAALSLVLGQHTATTQMIARSQISRVALLLPLAAGGAGALHLLQSERDSLVSGAAVGMLVAASLAPPAGLVGMASAIGRWDLALNGSYVLLIQLVGINLSGALVFRWGGLAGGGARYASSTPRLFRFGTAVTVLLLAGLLTWQFSTSPQLERSSMARRVAAELRQALHDDTLAAPVEVSARFTRADIEGQNTLLGTIYVQPKVSSLPPDSLRQVLTRRLQERVRARWPELTPLLNVTVLSPPPGEE